MSEQLTNTPHQTAEMLGITPVTLRRWCEYHAAHLSPGANPLAGKARRFTGKDIEVLKHVRSLRDRGLTTGDINEQLQTLTFAEIDTSEQDDTAVALAQTAQEAQGLTPAMHVALDDLRMQIRAIQQTNQATGKHQRDYVQGIALGALGMGVLVMILIGLAVLYGGFR